MLRVVSLLAVVILAPAVADVPLVPPMRPDPSPGTPAYQPFLPLFPTVP